MKIKKLTDLIPIINANPSLTFREIGNMLTPRRKEQTILKYVRLLKASGHIIPARKRGRRKLTI